MRNKTLREVDHEVLILSFDDLEENEIGTDD